VSDRGRRLLDRQQQIRGALDLVDHRGAIEARDKAGRIGERRGARGAIVERDDACGMVLLGDDRGQVLLPTCRAPMTNTTRVSLSASTIKARA
jgi:hypothetical protein